MLTIFYPVSRATTPAVESFIEKNRLPHLLFYGPPGTGKTSTILAMARKIYGDNWRNNVLEVRRSCPIPNSISASNG